MGSPLHFTIDRTARLPLAAQIHAAISVAVRSGQIEPGARLPSWRDLASQLGVARGTVRTAYEMLADEQLIAGRGAAATFVRSQTFLPPVGKIESDLPSLLRFSEAWGKAPLPFQPGIPAYDVFPSKLWKRLSVHHAREAVAMPVTHPDPRGHPELRQQIASYLSIARGMRCTPGQVLITPGYSGALGLAVHALKLQGASAWVENPGFPMTRTALGIADVKCVPIPVDAEGLDVAVGVRRANHAAFAVVTPGQQAPLGMPMSLARRVALLAWAERTGAWIVEDDYLSELQLGGRSAPALASLDHAGRVLHAGSFSKTMSPALRLGFLVVPPTLADRFAAYTAYLAPTSSISLHRAVAEFMAHGHYLRHLRRMKRIYAARQSALMTLLSDLGGRTFTRISSNSLAIRVDFKSRLHDTEIAARARAIGLAPAALSRWFEPPALEQGLLLGFTTFDEKRAAADCKKLLEIIG